MQHIQGTEICDNCYETGHKQAREYHSLESGKGNKIIWYECGHVLIIKDDTVVQQFNYAEK